MDKDELDKRRLRVVRGEGAGEHEPLLDRMVRDQAVEEAIARWADDHPDEPVDLRAIRDHAQEQVDARETSPFDPLLEILVHHTDDSTGQLDEEGGRKVVAAMLEGLAQTLIEKAGGESTATVAAVPSEPSTEPSDPKLKVELSLDLGSLFGSLFGSPPAKDTQ